MRIQAVVQLTELVDRHGTNHQDVKMKVHQLTNNV